MLCHLCACGIKLKNFNFIIATGMEWAVFIFKSGAQLGLFSGVINLISIKVLKNLLVSLDF